MIQWLGGDFVFNGFARCQLWFDNPNKAAVLFVEIALIGTFLAVERRRGLRILGVVAFAAATLLLLLTFSRGGAVALLLGLLIMSPHWIGKVHGRRLRSVGCLVLLVCMGVISVRIGFAERMWRGFSGCDRSVVNRLDLWRKVPQMIHDAPWGWGLGKSGEAYMQWYQPLERSERYRTLVNSHLTMIVELGIVGGLGWVLLWSLLIGSGCGCARRCGSWLCLSEWLSFFVAGWFSSVCEDWMLWVIPALVLVLSLAWLPYDWSRVLSARSFFGRHGPSFVVYVIAIALFLTMYTDSGIHSRFGRITIGKGEPTIWMLPDDAVLGGVLFPREIRRFLQGGGKGTFVLAEDSSDVPSDVDFVVICGSAKAFGVRGNKNTIWLCPDRQRQISCKDDFIVTGEFANKWSTCSTNIIVVEGAANYIPDWPERIVALCAPQRR